MEGSTIPIAPEVSIVVPLYNESGNVTELGRSLAAVRAQLPPSEVVMVDDGSTDGTTRELMELHRSDPWFRVVFLTRNFGQTAAIAAGVDHAHGLVVVTMDGDLQNDPDDIPAVLAKLSEGYDVVSGWRVGRKAPFWSRRFPSAIANRIISRATHVRLHDYGCTLKAYRREVIDGLELYGDAHRFLPALAYVVGERVGEVPVNDRPRVHGSSKYGLSRVLRVALDILALPLMLRFFNRPIRFFGALGLAFGSLATGIMAWLIFERFHDGRSIGAGPYFIVAVLVYIVALQMILFGLVGELIVRSYYAVRGRTAYHVRRALTECTADHACASTTPAVSG